MYQCINLNAQHGLLGKKVQGICKLWLEHPGAGAQIMIVRNGKVILEQCFGYGDIEKKTPITQDSIFAVASVTKQVTAMCIAILHERGLLDIDDDIRKYIPDLVKFPQLVTISNLLHHTGGLRESYEVWNLHKKEENALLNQENLTSVVAKQTELNFVPGTDFTYCNAGYLLLTHIVHRASGVPFCEFARKNIFEPLGMENTGFRLTPDTEISNMVTSYYDNGYRYMAAPSTNYSFGSGGMLSNCRDLMKLLPQYVEPTLICRETLEKVFLHIPPLQDGTVTNYACGVRIDDLDGYRVIQHGGVTSGYRTIVVVVPEENLMVALCSNTHNIPTTPAGKDITRAALGLPNRKRMTLNPALEKEVAPEDIAGVYYHENSGRIFCVRVENGIPQLQYMQEWVPLVQVGKNFYKLGRRNIIFAFGDGPVLNLDEEILHLRKTSDVTDPAIAAEYLGSYYSKEVDGWFDVTWEQGELCLLRNSVIKRVLHPVGEETFAYGSADRKSHIRFLRGEEGKVTGLAYMSAQIRCILYVKTE